MSKTAVSTIISRMKLRYDYNITGDADLDALMLDILNEATKQVKQFLYDGGVMQDITAQASFQIIPGQEYRDITKAVIIGDTASFTGIAGDTIDLHVDGTDYADIDISGATDIDDVVTAIEAVIAGVASNNATTGTLQLSSLTTGSTSIVTIADGTTTAQTVVGDLFSNSDDRTASGITDVDYIISLTERVNQKTIELIPWQTFRKFYPKPSSNSTTSPDFASRNAGRIYFGPQPSSYTRIYIDYVKLLTAMTSASTMPFDEKYDMLAIAQGRYEYLLWQDPSNRQSIASAREVRDLLKAELITLAAKDMRVMAPLGRDFSELWGPQAPETGDFSAG
ncbi:MAG: hypothetical protein KKD77_22900 [Gammaproteobacteria bacterium]|nr:hypothetical protein [Gammaproteobacteria bacterium]